MERQSLSRRGFAYRWGCYSAGLPNRGQKTKTTDCAPSPRRLPCLSSNADHSVANDALIIPYRENDVKLGKGCCGFQFEMSYFIPNLKCHIVLIPGNTFRGRKYHETTPLHGGRNEKIPSAPRSPKRTSYPRPSSLAHGRQLPTCHPPQAALPPTGGARAQTTATCTTTTPENHPAASNKPSSNCDNLSTTTSICATSKRS
jgi:hypothetical protein